MTEEFYGDPNWMWTERGIVSFDPDEVTALKEAGVSAALITGEAVYSPADSNDVFQIKDISAWPGWGPGLEPKAVPVVPPPAVAQPNILQGGLWAPGSMWQALTDPAGYAAWKASQGAGIALAAVPSIGGAGVTTGFDWGALLTQLTPAALGAAQGALGAATGVRAGSIVGGTIIASGGGRVMVRTTTGRTVVIQRKQHRRYRSSGRRNHMDKLMELAMLKMIK